MSRRRVRLSAAAALAAVALASVGAAAAAGGCQLAMLPMPIQMEGTRPTVEVKINGAPTRLLVDTGAFFSMIPEAAARQYGLKVGGVGANLEVKGIGGSITPGVTTVRDLDVGGVPFHNYEFLVGGSDPTGGTAGLLGENILHAADLEFDLADGVMRFVRAKNCGDASLAYWAKTERPSVIPLEADKARRGSIVSSAFVNGHRIRVIFDTGAARSFLTLAAARRAGVDMDARRVGQSFGIGRRMVEERLGLIDSFKIGDEQILHTEIPMADSEFGADMLLGADFFLSHRILIANSQGKIYFTYNGGSVFALHPRAGVADAGTGAAPTPVAEGKPEVKPIGPGLRAVTATAEAEPTDAGGFGRRGDARLGRLEYGPAIADFKRAHDLAPNDPAWLFGRAEAYLRNRQPLLARADLDAAIALRPDEPLYRIARAQLRLSGPNRDAAGADLEVAGKALADQDDRRLALAQLYQRAGEFPRAVDNFDRWIKAHRQDARLSIALAGRCWSLAASAAPAEAITACDGAVRQGGKNPSALTARGMAELKAGDEARAMADFDQALGLQAQAPWALWGRALVEQRRGEIEKATSDAAAARARVGDIAEVAARYRLPAGPPAASPPRRQAAPPSHDTPPPEAAPHDDQAGPGGV